MGELYLDNVERAAVTRGTGRVSITDRPARRFVADPDARPRRAVHVPGTAVNGPVGELMTTLQGWFGHRNDPAEAAG